MKGEKTFEPHMHGPQLELHANVPAAEKELAKMKPPVLLLPRSQLFTAFQGSYTANLQAVLARWAEGDFHAGDDKVKAAETPSTKDNRVY